MPKSTLCIDFSPELRLDLECFREANLRTPSSNVVRQALQEFISQQLAVNPALRVKFDSIKAEKLRQARIDAGDKVSFLPKRKRNAK